jgi:hypothetical protein
MRTLTGLGIEPALCIGRERVLPAHCPGTARHRQSVRSHDLEVWELCRSCAQWTGGPGALRGVSLCRDVVRAQSLTTPNWNIRPDAPILTLMDDSPTPASVRAGWLEALVESEAELVAGLTVPGDVVMGELYESIARMDAKQADAKKRRVTRRPR